PTPHAAVRALECLHRSRKLGWERWCHTRDRRGVSLAPDRRIVGHREHDRVGSGKPQVKRATVIAIRHPAILRHQSERTIEQDLDWLLSFRLLERARPCDEPRFD